MTLHHANDSRKLTILVPFLRRSVLFGRCSRDGRAGLMMYMWFAEAAALVLGLIGIVVAAFLAELGGPVARWLAERNGFVDRGQSPLVRRVAVRLSSRRTKERMRAVELLRDMRDTSAVPALARAIQRYDHDPRLLQALVEAVGALGDPRALPAVRPLAHGRNQSLMEAARRALARLEPHATLLRPVENGHTAEISLLRPAISSASPPETLLRAEHTGSPKP